ncbi:MAG TPA: lysophospholipid acyltransferase family protein [Clostridia bacterium]|nr:lysophospholipid acyltransferase family protein [Clostridia bacterium]
MALLTEEYTSLEIDRSVNAPKQNSLWLRAAQQIAFYVAYLIFGIVGVATSVGASLLALVLQSDAGRSWGQRLIHSLFAFFVWYVRACGLLRLKAEGLEALRGRSNLILVANHPSLLDAVFIAAHLPNVFCLMKASLIYNIVLCGQAKLAGYVNNQSGVSLVKSCQARLREGSNLLVFPEGTRTRGGLLGPMKMGFAVVSRSQQAPVQTLLIQYDHPFLGKDWAFFKAPPFPLHCTITLGKQFHPEACSNSQAFGREIEAYLRDAFSKSRPPGHDSTRDES